MASEKIRFGDFVLDPARRELSRDGTAVRLPPKAFDCLAYLVENRHRAVGRDELIAQVWGRTEIDDNLLDQAITRLRRVLGDNDEARRMIRTVPRFGYAWVAPTTQVADDAPPPAIESAAPAMEPAPATVPAAEVPTPAALPHRAKPPSRMVWLAVAAAVVALVIGALQWSPSRNDKTNAAVTSANLGVVLPLLVDAGSGYAWARLGVMDLVAERLRASGQAMVPSDNVVALAREFDGRSPSPEQLRAFTAATGAGLVIEAKGELSGGYWRIALRGLHGRDPAPRAEAESQDLMDAARAAADKFAREIGRTPPPNDVIDPRERALAAVMQQVSSAMLGNDLVAARALLETLEPEQRALPEVRYQLAQLDYRAGRMDAAENAFNALLERTSAEDAPLFRARVLSALGHVALRRDDYVLSASRADAAIGVLGDGPPSVELGRAYATRAKSRSAASQFEAALPDFARARVVLESVGDRYGLAKVETDLGVLDARRDHYAEALPVLERAAERLYEFHDATNEIFARVPLVFTRLALLDAPGALREDKRLAELAQREPSPQWKLYIAITRCELLAANGRLAESAALLQTVLAQAEASEDASMLGSARVVAARRAQLAGRNDEAERIARAVLASHWNAESAREQASLYLTLLRAQIATGRLDAAAGTVAAAGAWAQGDASLGARMYASLIVAEGAAAAKDINRARAAYEDALASAESGRVPSDVLEVSDAYATWLIAQGDLARASTVAARTAGWADSSYEAALLQARLYQALKQEAPQRAALARAESLAGERTIPAPLAAGL